MEGNSFGSEKHDTFHNISPTIEQYAQSILLKSYSTEISLRMYKNSIYLCEEIDVEPVCPLVLRGFNLSQKHTLRYPDT